MQKKPGKTPRQPYRGIILKQTAIMTLVFMILNGYLLYRTGMAMDMTNLLRLFVSSLAIGWLAATVMWFLPKKN